MIFSKIVHTTLISALALGLLITAPVAAAPVDSDCEQEFSFTCMLEDLRRSLADLNTAWKMDARAGEEGEAAATRSEIPGSTSCSPGSPCAVTLPEVDEWDTDILSFQETEDPEAGAAGARSDSRFLGRSTLRSRKF